jgi:hypothetical protein
MGAPTFHAAPWGKIDDVRNHHGKPLFNEVYIRWQSPEAWEKGAPPPVNGASGRNHLYCLVRDHHRSERRGRIVYVGLTRALATRFANHTVAKQLLTMRGKTSLAVGDVQFGKYWHKQGDKRAIEQLEHILIWALSSSDLLNERKNRNTTWHGNPHSKAVAYKERRV